MYVNEEDVPLIASAIAPPNKDGKIWKFVATGVALSALGLIAVSVNGGLSKIISSKSEISEKRLQMSKLGTLKYGVLSDGEKSTLFDNFKTDYERKVVRTRKQIFMHF